MIMTMDLAIDSTDREAPNRAVAGWLLAVCALIFAMVVLGGVTRLTHSGLSMVDWKPLTGWLPPLSDSGWQDEFDNYKQYPEYQKINLGMTLGEFRQIFWFEFAHRVLGRLIGLAFLGPLIYFLIRRQIPRGLTPRLVTIFVFGGLQGLLGWYMVASGLVDRPDVSQYRLTAHLGLAVALYGLIMWTALDLLSRGQRSAAGPYGWGLGLVGLIFLMILSGGFVAGLDAGFLYNTFPLMDGRWVAEEAFSGPSLLHDLFEDRATIQFNHRLLALIVTLAVAAYWWQAQRAAATAAAQLAAHFLLAALAAQMALGILTLVYVVPVALAAAHQAGALVLLTAALCCVHAVGRGAA
jgi:cytochrome c oxidase assembly protein subunit 15